MQLFDDVPEEPKMALDKKRKVDHTAFVYQPVDKKRGDGRRVINGAVF